MTVGQRTAVSDPGRRRRRNEDVYVVRPPLFAVADGMGGAQAGEVAARLAADALVEDAADGGGEQRVVSLIQAANRRVYERANADAAASGMGTTMTVALVEGGRVAIGHVGDSRAYLLREGRLEQLTEDHSLVAELLRSGQLSAEEAERHPQRSVITRALGTDPDVDVDVFTVDARAGDVFMLCSDGLTTMLADEDILRVVEEKRDDLQAAARTLVGRANRSGGEDNITVVFFEIADDDGEQTVQLEAPVREPEPAPADDEDTLTEADAVPAVDTAVIPAEKIRQAIADAEAKDAAESRRSTAAAVALGLVVAAVLALVATLLWLTFA